MMLRPPLPVEDSDPGPETNSIFIHDFAPVSMSWVEAVERFTSTLTVPILNEVVVAAWNAEAGSAADRGLDVETCDREQLAVQVGRPRKRSDAVVIPVAWRGLDAWISPLDADVEVAVFGPDRLHVHILGRSRLPATVAPCTSAASLHQRLTVAVVRHVLAQLVDQVIGPPRST